jgi:hypothetical protein
MKTTIDIADALLEEARLRAASDGTTLRALVETGLRVVLARGAAETPFRLRDASFRGRGVQPGIAEGDWDAVRDLGYEGRGG